ncbi:MAG: molybdopterin molybdotransferase MoeA [Lachnospiraceae bacterium]|jgi:molybdopterin molybdotransferase|nr:molybdopterin molybdotransferase MoeA [Lachnospiraceae bacterium]
MKRSIPYTQAQQLILGLPDVRPETLTVTLADACGRVLAEDIVADIPIPPFAKSPFDGYALRSADTAGATVQAPVTLRITEEIPAGGVPKHKITPGFAAKILTGGAMPEGADCTEKYEVTTSTDETVTFTAPVSPGNVVRMGEDVPAGTVVGRRGDVVSPGAVGIFASVGRDKVMVYGRPKIGIISTGNELVEPGDELPPGKIYSSSALSLAGELAAMGIDAESFAIVPDDAGAIADAIRRCVAGYDAVITTGGASVGDYDFLREAVKMAGAEILFWKTKIKPGGTMLASEIDRKLVLSLSGNPGAALTGLLIIGRPYLLRIAGRNEIFPEKVQVHLRAPFTKNSGRSRMLRGRLEIDGGKAWFVEQGSQGSGALSSFVGCSLLAEIKPDEVPLEAGALVEAYRLPNY